MRTFLALLSRFLEFANFAVISDLNSGTEKKNLGNVIRNKYLTSFQPTFQSRLKEVLAIISIIFAMIPGNIDDDAFT